MNMCTFKEKTTNTYAHFLFQTSSPTVSTTVCFFLERNPNTLILAKTERFIKDYYVFLRFCIDGEIGCFFSPVDTYSYHGVYLECFNFNSISSI